MVENSNSKNLEVSIVQLIKKHTEVGKALLMNSKMKYEFVDPAPLSKFKDYDYLVRSKLIEEGHIQFKYIEADPADVKRYFLTGNEPKNRFSAFF